MSSGDRVLKGLERAAQMYMQPGWDYSMVRVEQAQSRKEDGWKTVQPMPHGLVLMRRKQGWQPIGGKSRWQSILGWFSSFRQRG